jgi:hypothetical protein
VFTLELLQRYVAALGELEGYWLLVPALALLGCWPPVHRAFARRARRLRPLLLLAVGCVALAFAWSLLWASDDAYITFRYAENLVRGHGLVYNPGERVEGYTDFLWALYAALAIWLRQDPAQAGVLLNLASFAGTLMLIARLAERNKPAPIPLGIAVLGFAVNYTSASFATAAIETMFATFLATLAFERADAGKPVIAGVSGSLAILTHPDHALFFAALAAALLLGGRRHWLRAARFALPFVLIVLPYFWWRWSYYGDPLPNTFYAKSADKLYFNQGARYAALTFIGSGLFALLPLVALGFYQARRTLFGRYAALVLIGYPLYVMKVGGDFMLGRLFVPVLPLWFLVADLGVRRLVQARQWKFACGLVALGGVSLLPTRIVKAGEISHGVADERSFGPIDDFSTMKSGAYGYRIGQGLYRDFAVRGVFPKMAIWSIGMAGYYSKLPVFDLRGLTTPSVAHLPIERRGRPGHEKEATPGLLLQADVELSEIPVFPAPYDELTRLDVGDGRFFLTRYDSALIDRLPVGHFPPNFARHVKRSLPELSKRERAELECDLFFYEEYYFSKNHDAALRDSIASAARTALPSLSGVEALLLDPADPAARGYEVVRRFEFEAGEPPWEATGDGDSWLEPGLRAGQEVPFAQRGRFVNSFDARSGAASRGSLRSPPFTIEGDALTFRLGGGNEPQALRVSLSIDGEPVQSSTGCNSSWLGRRVWNLAPFKGKTARIVLEDRGGDQFGFVLLDSVVEWRAPPARNSVPAAGH